MLTLVKRHFRLLVIINSAAALIGVAAAVAFARASVDAAFAANTCTHYTNPYGIYSATSSWEMDICNQYNYNYPTTNKTDSTAVRERNTFASRDVVKNWGLFYANGDGSYYCCLSTGWGTYASIGGSQGQFKKSACNFPSQSQPMSPDDRVYFYCNTLW